VSVDDATTFENCGRDFAKRKQSDAEFAGNRLLCMVFIDKIINTILGRLTLDPAGMHCPSWYDAFVSSYFYFLRHAQRSDPLTDFHA